MNTEKPEPPEGYELADRTLDHLPEGAMIRSQFIGDSWSFASRTPKDIPPEYHRHWWVAIPATRIPIPATGGVREQNVKLAEQVAELETQLAAIGNLAVADWDDAVVGKVDALVKEPTHYKDRLKALFIDIPKERDMLKQQVSELTAKLEEVTQERNKLLMDSLEAEFPNPIEKWNWRCFHCDAVFTDRAEAAKHFGTMEWDGSALAVDAPVCDNQYKSMEAGCRLLAKANESLTSQLAEARKDSEWRPISEAPKDGTRILVCGIPGHDVVIAFWNVYSPRPHWCWPGEPHNRADQPTHFQPLPPAPSTE